MKRFLTGTCLLLALHCHAQQDAPKATITNGLIKATLYLPDSAKGFYRATRFDWSGVIANLGYKGHSFYGQWFDEYSPQNNDAITGPSEVFFPVGYRDAPVGGTFVNIGVGLIRKPSDKPYSQFNTYDIVSGGKRTVVKGKDRISFTQQISDANGYGYIYTKTVRLIKGKPRMILEHSLKNTGKLPLITRVYNHNFPVIDNEPAGPNIKVFFTPTAILQGKDWGIIAEAAHGELTFLRYIKHNESLQCDSVTGLSQSAADYRFRVQNQKTGAGIRITGDQPVDRIVFWASDATYCPEPYININVKPGQEQKWQITYDYYTFKPNAR